MATAGLGVIDLITLIITDSIDFILNITSRIVGTIYSFGSGFGGMPLILIAIVIIGVVIYFFGEYILGAGRNIMLLLLLGIIMAILLIFL